MFKSKYELKKEELYCLYRALVTLYRMAYLDIQEWCGKEDDEEKYMFFSSAFHLYGFLKRCADIPDAGCAALWLLERGHKGLSDDEAELLLEALGILQKYSQEWSEHLMADIVHCLNDTITSIAFTLVYRTDLSLPNSDVFDISFDDYLHYHAIRPADNFMNYLMGVGMEIEEIASILKEEL